MFLYMADDCIWPCVLGCRVQNVEEISANTRSWEGSCTPMHLDIGCECVRVGVHECVSVLRCYLAACLNVSANTDALVRGSYVPLVIGV